MSSILGPIQQLGELLTGLTSDAGDVITVQFTATPEQPQPGDFPVLVIEIDPEREGRLEDVQGGVHLVYPINLLILVGTPATTPLSELHNQACAWVYPLAVRLCSDIKLSAVDDVLMLGDAGAGEGNAVFNFRVGGIPWNNVWFYGVHATTWIKECKALAMS